MDCAKFTDIFEQNLFKSVSHLRLGGSLSNKTPRWFKGKLVNTLDWPSQISDLNPIQNLWSNW